MAKTYTLEFTDQQLAFLQQAICELPKRIADPFLKQLADQLEPQLEKVRNEHVTMLRPRAEKE